MVGTLDAWCMTICHQVAFDLPSATRSSRHEPLAGWYTVVSIKAGEPGSVPALAYPLAVDTIVCFQMKASTTPAHPPQQVPCASPGGGALCCASPSGGPRLEFAPRQLSALLGPAAVAPAVLHPEAGVEALEQVAPLARLVSYDSLHLEAPRVGRVMGDQLLGRDMCWQRCEGHLSTDADRELESNRWISGVGKT